MSIKITINPDEIEKLDISPVEIVIEKLVKSGAIATTLPEISLEINYSQDPEDPRELSEIAEIRLWFIRLDAIYPWFPIVLDWKAGELSRYVAMLVPHQFHRKEGIQYNPEALEIFLMHKIFILTNWLNQQNLPSRSRLKSMAQLLGYELDDRFFDLLNS